MRLSPQTPIHLLGSAYTRLERCCSARRLAQATTPRAGIDCHWKARARRRKTAGAHSLFVRRVPPWIAYPCGTQTRAGSRRDVLLARTNGQAVRLRFLFVLFLSAQEKNTFLLYQRRRICRFLTDEKTTKRVVEASASNSHSSAGKHIPTARRCCSARGARTGHHSPCGN